MSKYRGEDVRFACPNCGTDLHANDKVCPNCGSDESTGWSENTYLDGLGIPFEDEYDEFKEQEFKNKRSRKIGWLTVTGVILIALFIVMMFRF